MARKRPKTRKQVIAAAKKSLYSIWKQHKIKKKCFNCRTTQRLHCSHIKVWCKDPSEMIKWHALGDRMSQTNEIYKELKKCGVLCEACHQKYDGVKKCGWKKQKWHDNYTKNGVAAADWDTWRLQHLEHSADWDVHISENPA